MAKNLGLGRMAARAFRPLPQILVADPLTMKLNAQYRPKRLAKEAAIKAFFRGAMTEVELRKELAEEGYSDGRQNLMVRDSRPILNDREIIKLYFQDFFKLEDMTIELKARGWADSDISAVVEIERPQMDKSEILDMLLYGGFTAEAAGAQLAKLGYDVTTAGLIIAGFMLKHDPSQRTKPLAIKHRTVLQLHKEFLDGVIDLTEWETQLTKMGFDDDSKTALTQDLLLDQAGRKTSPARHAVPSLSWAQLKAAFKAGVLNLQEVTNHLTHHGYSADDIATLLKELPPPPAPILPTGP
jgi:hypothetical protein